MAETIVVVSKNLLSAIAIREIRTHISQPMAYCRQAFARTVLLLSMVHCVAAAGTSSAEISPFMVKKLAANRFILSFSSPGLNAADIVRFSSHFPKASIPAGLTAKILPGFPIAPVATALIVVPPEGHIKVTLIEGNHRDLSNIDIARQSAPPSANASGNHTENVSSMPTQWWPQNLIEVSERGRLRGQEIVRIEVHPVQYDTLARMLRIHSILKFEIQFEVREFSGSSQATNKGTTMDPFLRSLRPLLINPDALRAYPTTHKGQDSLWYNPNFTYYKIAVNEQGIYSLTSDELEQAGVPAADLDLNTLKVILHGHQIPIWISGPIGTRLQPTNKIFFYGEPNHAANGDNDLYTDVSVYWLTDDGGPGLRYQQTSDTVPGAVAQPYYWETVRVEKDSLFFRWNGESTLATGEGWVSRFLFDNERHGFEFPVSAISPTADSSRLRLRIQGSTATRTNPDHHARVSFNGQALADIYFDDREERVIDIKIPTRWLLAATRHFDLQLVADTGADINQIVYDWAELTYPRLLKAREDELLFWAPGEGPSRFSVSNFKQPLLTVFAPTSAEFWQPRPEKSSYFSVQSAGFDDGNFCRMSVDLEPFEFKTRGHHLVAINPESRKIAVRSYDTYGSTVASELLAAFVDSLEPGTVVLAGILDEGSASMTESAYSALESLGSSLARYVGTRDSWALIGWKGASIGSVAEKLSRHLEGPAAIADTLTDSLALGYRVTFEDDALPSDFYVALNEEKAKKVVSIRNDRSSDLRGASNGADYIVITHRTFEQQAKTLADFHRRRDNFRVVTVDVEDIYDEFGDGIESPRAIKDFLRFAYQSWQPPAPTYVVLFGDASWDPKRNLASTRKLNFVPTYGDPVSDNWFVSFDGPDDYLPDMFIGRIPVETTEQADVILAKIVTYANLPYNIWNKQFLFFNGGKTSGEQSLFQSQATNLSQNFIERAPLNGRVEHFNKNTNEAITVSLLHRASERIEKGALWVNFVGHGGSAVWDISIGQPEDWQNSDTFPFFTGMSCHSARFANPSINSMSEQFVLNPFGAIAYWGSTGFGFVAQDFYLLEGIFRAVSQDGIRRFGEACALAKISMWQKLGGTQVADRMVASQYTLIGDPALSLHLPEGPELALTREDIVTGSEVVLTSDSSRTLNARIWNFGLLPSDSVSVQFATTFPDSASSVFAQQVVPPIPYFDSVQVKWPVPDTQGEYQVSVTVDPNNNIPESDENNNTAAVSVMVYSSDLTTIKPPDFAVVNKSDPVLVTTNSRIGAEGMFYSFEIDTSARFDSPLIQRSPLLEEGKLVAHWKPALSREGSYVWRVRSFSGANYGPWRTSQFRFSNDTQAGWKQDDFSNNLAIAFQTKLDGVEIEVQRIVLRAESAGLLDGNYAALSRNNDIVGLNRIGHNMAVFDEDSGDFITAASFDSWSNPAEADSMAALVNRLADGMNILVAIRDEGSASMTEAAYQALESIGSQFTRQVGLRDSWAIIGRKGAAIGSVPEVWKKSGDGPAVVADTLSRFAKSGAMTSVEIGPALAWKSAHFDYTSSFENERIAFNVLGRPKGGAGVDTLIRGLERVSDIDLSAIDPARYPKIQLMAEMTSLTGRESPALHAWSADFEPAADLVVDRNSLSVSPDSVQTGEAATATVELGNFGLHASGVFSVRIVATVPGKSAAEVGQFQVQNLEIDATGTYTTPIETSRILGAARLTAELDPENKVPELVESNNSAAATLVVVRDTLAPTIRVRFDGVALSQGEFVAATPAVAVEVLDSGQIPADSGHVTILLDDQTLATGPAEGEVQLLPQQNPENAQLRLVAAFSPNLDAGEHTLQVLSRDATGNLGYFDADFFVSDEFVIGNVMNFPNPFRDDTEFTYTLTQPADDVRIKVYTIAGRLILTLEDLPANAGFNQFRWNGLDQDGDALANGVYLYKIIARSGNQQVELVEKLVVMR